MRRHAEGVVKTVGLVLAGVLALVLGWLVYQQSYAQRMLRHLQQCLQYDSGRYDLGYETRAAMHRARRRARQAEEAKTA